MQKRIVANALLLPEVKKILSEGLTVTLPVTGNSMLPFIIGGRESVVLQKPSAPLQKGEIVLAQIAPDSYVIHRIVDCRGGQIILMGDGNLSATEACCPENVLGVVVKIMKAGKSMDCRTPLQRRKAALWYVLLPVRRYLVAIYRRLILK